MIDAPSEPARGLVCTSITGRSAGLDVKADCPNRRLSDVKLAGMMIAPYTSPLSILRIADARSVTCRSNL